MKFDVETKSYHENMHHYWWVYLLCRYNGKVLIRFIYLFICLCSSSQKPAWDYIFILLRFLLWRWIKKIRKIVIDNGFKNEITQKLCRKRLKMYLKIRSKNKKFSNQKQKKQILNEWWIKKCIELQSCNRHKIFFYRKNLIFHIKFYKIPYKRSQDTTITNILEKNDVTVPSTEL